MVRNFWATLKVDDTKTELATGPRRKDGGIRIVVEMRENGAIAEDKLEIIGKCRSDGTLDLYATFQGQEVFRIESER